MDPLISGPDHPRWTDPQFLALAQHKQEAKQMADKFDMNTPLDATSRLQEAAEERRAEESIASIKAMPMRSIYAAGKAEGCDKSTIPEGYMLVPIVLPPGIVTQATPAVEFPDKPGNMVERCWRLLISALQAKGY